MSPSHLSRAVQFICGKQSTTASQIAANAGLSHVVLSRACNGTRPETKTLKALCTSQPNPRDNMDLLVAHLRDEIERAGHSTSEIEINADRSRIDDDLRLLLEEAKSDKQLRGMLSQLAAFIRTHPMRDNAQAASEPQPPTSIFTEHLAPGSAVDGDSELKKRQAQIKAEGTAKRSGGSDANRARSA